MKVKDLIEALQNVNPELEVRLLAYNDVLEAATYDCCELAQEMKFEYDDIACILSSNYAIEIYNKIFKN